MRFSIDKDNHTFVYGFDSAVGYFYQCFTGKVMHMERSTLFHKMPRMEIVDRAATYEIEIPQHHMAQLLADVPFTDTDPHIVESVVMEHLGNTVTTDPVYMAGLLPCEPEWLNLSQDIYSIGGWIKLRYNPDDIDEYVANLAIGHEVTVTYSNGKEPEDMTVKEACNLLGCSRHKLADIIASDEDNDLAGIVYQHMINLPREEVVE